LAVRIILQRVHRLRMLHLLGLDAIVHGLIDFHLCKQQRSEGAGEHERQ
jgi:hypothetical protein